MSESQETATSSVVPLHNPGMTRSAPFVSFTRGELATILSVYGRRMMAGDLKDYAMDFLADRAVFSMYRRSSEMPLYRVEKTPRLARKQGTYQVIAATGQILKRGNELERVLKVLEPKLAAVY